VAPREREVHFWAHLMYNVYLPNIRGVLGLKGKTSMMYPRELWMKLGEERGGSV
jgi:hypothetical protein